MHRRYPVRHGHWLLWGVDHGWRIPRPFSSWLVRGWNAVACRVWGHDDALWHLAFEVDGTRRVVEIADEAPFSFPAEDARCPNCLVPLTGCTGTGISHGREAYRRTAGYFQALREIERLTQTHTDQPAHVAWHLLTVDIAAICRAALRDQAHEGRA